MVFVPYLSFISLIIFIERTFFFTEHDKIPMLKKSQYLYFTTQSIRYFLEGVPRLICK